MTKTISQHRLASLTGERRWFMLALTFLGLAGIIGVLLRAIHVVDLPWLLFRPWMHAHAYAAMLGWVFPGLLIALTGQDDRPFPRTFRTCMVLLPVLALGILLLFPVQGMGPLAIAACLLHLAVGYVAVVQAWRHVRAWPASGSRLLARFALVFHVVATLAVWAWWPLRAAGLGNSEWYYWSVQWFLHFEFNGWCWFAVMAVAARWAERHGVTVRLDPFTAVLWALSAVLSFALTIAWSERHVAVLAVHAAGVVLQAWAAWRTWRALHRAQAAALVRPTPLMRVPIAVLLACMVFKVAIHAAVAVPVVAEMALTLRNQVVGFIHLNTLGIATMLLFAFAISRGWFDERRRAVRFAVWTFVVGLVASELLLFGQGMAFWLGWGLLPGYHWTITAMSVLMPLAAWVLWGSALRRPLSG